MKNKKIPAILLGIACMAILIGAISLNRKAEPEFIPEATEPTVSDSWEEKRTQDSQVQAELQETEPQSPGASGSADDATQTVVTEEPQQVVTELTQPVKKEQVQADTIPDSPPADSEKNGRLPSCDRAESETAKAPAETQAETTQEQTSAPETPTQGGDSHEGQVYDPVFGWITPAPAQGQVIDNDGDVNKQIGTMN